MLFWYKDGMGMPLYSLDARFGPVGKATHFANTDNLGTRTHFITEDEPSKARLRIERVTEQDQGVFRCRVDFVNSPTRNFRVNLTLVVQPSAPKIFDAEGKEVRINAPAGPFLEGRELSSKAICDLVEQWNDARWGNRFRQVILHHSESARD
ncbi:unnamed protein product [Acanthoscelides obtectus]|uniref:Ig-like domain-containing protein n=1 Tax=Acanthoscelides obtectus TaxID=200917 RepID=A0A9P0KXM8_ACAOB|nr:unnamed protein product [Acanthoscelides obtectus]CAK1639254.1 hypothetical protein AOBTE_LOCUS11070 [Acanthoscelides obtectus]